MSFRDRVLNFGRNGTEDESVANSKARGLVDSLLGQLEANQSAQKIRGYLEERKIAVVAARSQSNGHGSNPFNLLVGRETVPREAFLVMQVDTGAFKNGRNHVTRFEDFVDEAAKEIRNINLQGYPLGEVTENAVIAVLSNVVHEH